MSKTSRKFPKTISESIRTTFPTSTANLNQAQMPETNNAGQRRINDGVGDPDCPQCHGLGYLRPDVPVGDPNFGKLQVCPCSADRFQSERLSQLLRLSNIESLAGKTFDTFLPEGVGDRKS